MNKDTRAVMIAAVVELLIMEISHRINGGTGLATFLLGTALLLMYAYYEHKQEQALARERRKVKMLAGKIREICEREDDYRRSVKNESIENHHLG